MTAAQDYYLYQKSVIEENKDKKKRPGIDGKNARVR